MKFYLIKCAKLIRSGNFLFLNLVIFVKFTKKHEIIQFVIQNTNLYSKTRGSFKKK